MTPPTNDSKQQGSWKEDVEAIILKVRNFQTNHIHRNMDKDELSPSDALQAIVEANKKWLIKDDEVETVGKTRFVSKATRNQLRDEQRKAMM